MLLCSFQFLYGAIKSWIGETEAESSYIFQFQYGAIKRIHGLTINLLKLDFNSSMVRLKVEDLSAQLNW
jgi:hypothetical protein